MKILCIGDIVGRTGRDMVFDYMERLPADIGLVVANGENAAHGRGMSKPVYEELKKAGIDGFTLGNHTWGSMVLRAKNGISVGIINIIGRTYMQPADCPFEAADAAIERLQEQADILLVDFHAEATSEKIAMGYYLDGRVSAVFGTHTHVQTADETVLPRGTGYISDLGMTGPVHSVLGMEKTRVIDRFVTGMPQKFEVASGAGQFCGCIFEIDEQSGKTRNVERIFIRQQ